MRDKVIYSSAIPAEFMGRTFQDSNEAYAQGIMTVEISPDSEYLQTQRVNLHDSANLIPYFLFKTTSLVAGGFIPSTSLIWKLAMDHLLRGVFITGFCFL